MGVPKQVLEMEAETEEALEVKAGETAEVTTTQVAEEQPSEVRHEENAAVVQTEAENENPAEETPAQADGRTANLLSKVGAEREAASEASAKGRLAVLQGQRRIDHEEWERKRKEFEEEIASLKRENEELRKSREANAHSVKSGDNDKLYKRLVEKGYSDEDAREFIEMVSSAADERMRPLKERMDAADKERAERAKAEADAIAKRFTDSLEKEFPGFREIDAGNDPRWIAFLDSDIGGVFAGTTYKDIAEDALKRLDYRKFSAVVRQFAKSNGIVFSSNGKPASAAVMSEVRPSSKPAAERGASQGKPRKVPRSEINAFRRAAFAHKAERIYGIGSDKVEAYLRFYEDAEADGNVAENE